MAQPFRLYRSLVLLALFLARTASAEVTWAAVKPSVTDPRIHEADTPHSICVNRDIVVDHKGPADDRHELLLFLTGTGGHGRGAKAFVETAANLGYHCIELMYPDDIPASVCCQDSSPTSFEQFRMAIIHGGSATHIRIAPADSIESRLTMLLIYLAKVKPLENWEQFLDPNGIAWEKIAVSGQSQGGGHAGLIGIKVRVARVIMFGAPKDYSLYRGRPAAWYSDPKATPASAFFAINHMQDRQACDFRQQLQNLRALGLNPLGKPVDVDSSKPPYDQSHILVTNYPGTSVDSITAHTTAISDKHADLFRPVWIYMLTAPTEPSPVSAHPAAP